jgi:hypothetical protein
MTINDVADERARRLTKIFLKDERGKRPIIHGYGKNGNRSALSRLHSGMNENLPNFA